MNEIKIIEIQIYSMKEKIIDKKWKEFFDNNFGENENYNDIKQCYFPQYVWKYNQIIGYLEVTYVNSTIWFKEYCTMDEKIYAKSKTKHYIINMQLNGHHFFVKDGMKNSEIIEEIVFWINSFEKEVMNKKYYLNKEEYINILKCMNIRQLIEI